MIAESCTSNDCELERTDLRTKLQDAQAQNTAYREDNVHQEHLRSHLAGEMEAARRMVLRLVVVQYREGWETGETEAELSSRAIDRLANWGLDPHNNPERCKEALKSFNGEVSLAQMRSNQELREATERELQECEKELEEANTRIEELKEKNDGT